MPDTVLDGVIKINKVPAFLGILGRRTKESPEIAYKISEHVYLEKRVQISLIFKGTVFYT